MQRNGHTRPIPCQRLRDLTPIDERHREVGEDQIERLGARLNESQRGLAVSSLFHVKVFGFEHAADELTHRPFVVDHQHAGPMPDGTVGSGRSCVHMAPAGSRGALQILLKRFEI
jgi:hypothetical protein